jgi:hypothetical protein
MNRKWLAAFTFCILALGLTLALQGSGRAQAPATTPGPAPLPPQALAEGSTESSWIAAEPFDVFTAPMDLAGEPGVPLPDPAAGDVFFYTADASAGIAVGDAPELAEFTAAIPVPPPDAQVGVATGNVSFVGPDPKDTITFVGFEAGLGNQAVAGAPYSAEITSEFVQTLPDGNKIERKTTTTVYRDGQGRTRREQTLPAIGQYAASSNTPQAIFINDPVAGASYVLDPAKKIARKMPRPNVQFFQGGPGGPGRGAVAIGPGPGPGGPGGNPPPPPGNAGPAGPGPGRGPRGPDPNVATESLGTQNIEGILVQGTRVVRTIPAGAVGNQNPIRVTSERWYSPDLKLNLSVKNTDPMRGENSTTLSSIRRDEPAASLFQVPADYTVQEPPKRMIMRGRGGPVPPPPPPQQ